MVADPARGQVSNRDMEKKNWGITSIVHTIEAIDTN